MSMPPRLEELLTKWLSTSHGDAVGHGHPEHPPREGGAFATLSWRMFRMSLAKVLQCCGSAEKAALPDMVARLKGSLARAGLAWKKDLADRFHPQQLLFPERDTTGSLGAVDERGGVVGSQNGVAGEKERGGVLGLDASEDNEIEFAPIVLDVYWLTHVLLFHRAGPLGLAHANCRRQFGQDCDTARLWYHGGDLHEHDSTDREATAALTALTRLAPLLVLWLKEVEYSTLPSRPHQVNDARDILAKDALAEVVLVLRHFYGVKHPLAAALAHRVKSNALDVGGDGSAHATAVLWAMGSQEQRLRRQRAPVAPSSHHDHESLRVDRSAPALRDHGDESGAAGHTNPRKKKSFLAFLAAQTNFFKLWLAVVLLGSEIIILVLLLCWCKSDLWGGDKQGSVSSRRHL